MTPAAINRRLASVPAEALVARALVVLEERLRYPDTVLTSPNVVRDYLRLRLAAREREAFLCIWLDAQHRLIECEQLFEGTLTQTSVYPREIVKSALRRNAAAVIFAHNHPSGVAEASQADQVLTESLQRALALVDVKVIDHMIVGAGACMSFAEKGLL